MNRSSARLATRIGPLALVNPVLAGSGELTMTEAGISACLEAGAGAVVAKSVNESAAAARQLDIADYALLGPDWTVGDWARPGRADTLLNRSGLAQVELDDWLGVLARTDARARELGSYVFASITVAGAAPAARIAAQMAGAVRCVELNVGAPHAGEAADGAIRRLTLGEGVAEYTRAVRAAIPDTVLVVKLGQADDVAGMAAAAAGAGADAVTLIGRHQGFMPDLASWDPVLGSWGAVGGPWSLPLSLYWVSRVHRALPGLPLVGTNGARSGLDVARFLLSGARAVEMTSALLMRGPAVLVEAIAELDAYLAARPAAAWDMVGVAARRARSYAEITAAGPPPAPWRRFLDQEP